MPHATVLLYRENEEVPILEWLEQLSGAPRERVRRQLQRLADQGHDARRPLVENLGVGIYELRTRVGKVNYRILFSFYGGNSVLLTCGFTKEREIPSLELIRARRRLETFWPIRQVITWRCKLEHH